MPACYVVSLSLNSSFKGWHTISPPRAIWRNIRAKILSVSPSHVRSRGEEVGATDGFGGSVSIRGRREKVPGNRRNDDGNERPSVRMRTYWRLMIAGLFGKSKIPRTNNS